MRVRMSLFRGLGLMQNIGMDLCTKKSWTIHNTKMVQSTSNYEGAVERRVQSADPLSLTGQKRKQTMQRATSHSQP